MAKRAKPGVDVFIDWGTLRWGGACNWYPGFSPGTHKESTHTENDPTYAAESEAGLRLHIGAPKTANRARTTWALERSWRVISFGVDSGASSGPAFPSYGPEGRTSAVTLSLGIGQCQGGTRCPNLFKTADYTGDVGVGKSETLRINSRENPDFINSLAKNRHCTQNGQAKGVLSVNAFHEEAGRSQVGSCLMVGHVFSSPAEWPLSPCFHPHSM